GRAATGRLGAPSVRVGMRAADAGDGPARRGGHVAQHTDRSGPADARRDAPDRPGATSRQGRHSMVEHDVKNLSLAAEGRLKIEWAEQSMPVLRQVRERFTREQPLKGIRLGACLQVPPKTAVLMLTLKAGGAQLALCASNPLSTQDDTAAALVGQYEIAVFAHKGEDNERYYRHLASVLTT